MRMRENKFLSFFVPLFDYIDSVKFFREPFRWLYAIIAVLNLLAPIVLLAIAGSNDLFDYGGGKLIAAFSLAWIVFVFIMWIGFQLWWNRREKVYAVSEAQDDFVAIPVYSHFIQTCGEWLGVVIGIGGTLFSLIAVLFGVADAFRMLYLPVGGILLFPVYGFMAVVVTRVLAETFRALASIANNTKKH